MPSQSSPPDAAEQLAPGARAFSRPLHILYLMDEIKVKGGSEKHLLELATGMAGAGFRVSVFSLAEGAYASRFREAPGIEYRSLNVTRIYDAKGLSALFSLAGYIRRQQVDVLQSFHTASDLIGPLAARLSLGGTKILSSRRDLGYTKSARHVKMQRLVNRLVDYILANSKAVKKSIMEKEAFPEERIHTIFNGIDPAPFAAATAARERKRAALGAGADQIMIGSVGNIRLVKGYDLLVEAAAAVLERNSAVRFLHVGDGEMRGALEARCRELGIAGRFRFLGASKEVASFLAALDIYVQPSRSEGMSNAIMEAMAAGLPVVATDVGGNPDLVEHGVTGLLVPAEDSAALAEQLLHLAGQPQLRRELAGRSQDQLQGRFHINRMMDSYTRKYLELVKR